MRFLSVLTATVASHFVDKGAEPDQDELLAALSRIESELADINRRIDHGSHSSAEA